MSFTTEHYNKIAAVFEAVHPCDQTSAFLKQILIDRLIKMFEEDNPKFRAIQFLDACYCGDEDETKTI